MARIALAALAAATLVTSAVPGSPLRAQVVIETPSAQIELLGLHNWTLRMIEDSLALYSPTDSLTAHACAAILRGKLHFADASVNTFTNFPNMKGKEYVAITVVEPQDSSRIHYKSFKDDSLPARADWRAAFDAIKSGVVAQRAIQSPTFFAGTMSAEDSLRFAPVRALGEFLRHHRTQADLVMARRALATDTIHADRVVAAIILGNFPKRDEAWLTLVDALRDPVGIVSGTSAQVLGMLTRSASRRVDWAPLAASLRYIIDGTNLFGFDQTVKTLAATKVSPSLASALMGGGGDIVRAKLNSSAPGVRDGVAEFLSQLSGLPASTDAATFGRWMDSLDTRRASQHRR